jgi:hypothetical protein
LDRGEGGVIPELGEGVVEEGVSSKEHIRRMALGKRTDVDLGKDSYLPGGRRRRGWVGRGGGLWWPRDGLI